MTPSPLASPSAPLAVTVILASIAGGLYLGRALARRQRRLDRSESRSLLFLMRGTLGGEPWGDRMKRTAARTDAATFWAAIERLSLGPYRRGLRRLAVTLDRNPHVATERTRLQDDSPWRRELAARRLGLLPCKGTTPLLRRTMRRGPESVRLAAAHALARARDLAALRWLLAHPDKLARRSRRAWADLLVAFRRRRSIASTKRRSSTATSSTPARWST